MNLCVCCGDEIPEGKQVCNGCLMGRPGGKKRSKYHNRKIEANGIKFDSVKEYRRWCELKMLEEQGKISNVRRQVKYELLPRQNDESGRMVERPVNYIADFVYREGDELVCEDTKGIRTKEYIIKRKLMRYIYKIAIREV